MLYFFLYYRRCYVVYTMYAFIFPFLSSVEIDRWERIIIFHNASIRKKQVERDRFYLDTVMGNKIYLETSQREAIVSKAPYLLICAGAGSGKTTTILAKIKYLVEREHISPSSIGVISYTNETVKELRGKLGKMFQVPVSVFTFHTFALSILSQKRKIIVDRKPILKEIIENRLSFSEKTQMYKIFSTYFWGPSFLLSYLPINVYEKIFGQKGISLLDTLLSYIEKKLCDMELGFSGVVFENENQRKFMENICSLYKKYMRECGLIDFEGMIEEATLFLKKEGKKDHAFTYIFVDEYQDISYNRFLLLYEYVTKYRCHLCAVGDDFQSIFAFSGSKIDLFTDFKFHFKGSEMYTISKTYRNSQALIEIAGRFIMKNPKQIYKNLVSDKKEENPIFFWYYREDKIKILEKCLKEIPKGTVALLGRFRADITFLSKSPKFKMEGDKVYYKNRKDLFISFLTVHGSKGLGFDTVVILNMERGKYGFPSERENNQNGEVEYAEERRLFYVALTRTKGKVHLLIPKSNTSLFALEILKDNPQKIACIHS